MTYRVTIPGFVPTSLNKLSAGTHWGTRTRIKARDARTIDRACALARVPRVGVSAAERKTRKALKLPAKLPTDPAPVRRRVSLEITWAKGQRSYDEDNCLKALLDSLKKGGYLFDDSKRWCEPVLPLTYYRSANEYCETVVILEDLAPLPQMPKKPIKQGFSA